MNSLGLGLGLQGVGGTPVETVQLCLGGQARQVDKAGDNSSQREQHVQGCGVVKLYGVFLEQQRVQGDKRTRCGRTGEETTGVQGGREAGLPCTMPVSWTLSGTWCNARKFSEKI